MRISDWSSDVCSSDLAPGLVHHRPYAVNRRRLHRSGTGREAASMILSRHTSQRTLPMPADNPQSLPAYQRIRDTLRAKIESGEYREGDRLPPESKLVEEFGVASMTVRPALAQLVVENQHVRAACRDRVCPDGEISVGRESFKKKKQ